MNTDVNTCEEEKVKNQAPSVPELKRWKAGTLTYSMGGLVVLFCWLLMGDFAWAMKERSVYTVVQLLFKKFGTSDTLNSLFMGSLPSAISLFLGPAISYRSDRHRGSRGRRIPYLIITTPIASLAMVGLAFSPMLGRMLHDLFGIYSPGTNAITITLLGIFWIIFEVGTIAANAIFGALINDVVPHQFLGRFYGLFRAFSLIAGIIFNLWLLGKAEQHYMWIFIGIGFIYGAGFLIMCLKVKEGEYQPVPPGREKDTPFEGIATYFKECFSNPYYRWVFIAFTISTLSFAPVNLFSVFYAKSLNISMDDYGRFIAITFVLSLILSWFLGALADRFHPLRMCMASLLLYAVGALLSGIFIQGRLTFGAALISHCVISGIFFTSTASLGQRLYPKDRFAQFASACGIIVAVAMMIISPVIGKILDLTNHAYQWTYIMGAIFAILGLVTTIIVYRKFLALGGHTHYQPPDTAVQQSSM
ncbi:MAG: MFS transporter [Lentisphaerota bacterium]